MKQKLLSLFLAFILLFEIIVPVSGNTVHAASEMDKAKALYKKILQKGEVSYRDNDGTHFVVIKSFCLLDIDKNGIPELVVKDAQADGSFSTRYIYTVKNRKLIYCGNYYQKGQAELQCSLKYKSVYHLWWTNSIGGAGSILYKLKKNKMKEYKYMYTSQESPTSDKIEYWYGNSRKTAKKINKKKYSLLYKKYFGEVKLYVFCDNTEKDRRLYLK